MKIDPNYTISVSKNNSLNNNNKNVNANNNLTNNDLTEDKFTPSFKASIGSRLSENALSKARNVWEQAVGERLRSKVPLPKKYNNCK